MKTKNKKYIERNIYLVKTAAAADFKTGISFPTGAKTDRQTKTLHLADVGLSGPHKWLKRLRPQASCR